MVASKLQNVHCVLTVNVLPRSSASFPMLLALPPTLRANIRSHCSLADRACLDRVCRQLRAEEPLWFKMHWFRAMHAQHPLCFAAIWAMGGMERTIWQFESSSTLFYRPFGDKHTLELARPRDATSSQPWCLLDKGVCIAAAPTLELLMETPVWQAHVETGQLGPALKARNKEYVTAL